LSSGFSGVSICVDQLFLAGASYSNFWPAESHNKGYSPNQFPNHGGCFVLEAGRRGGKQIAVMLPWFANVRPFEIARQHDCPEACPIRKKSSSNQPEAVKPRFERRSIPGFLVGRLSWCSKAFVFYDIETTDSDTTFDQIKQFAACVRQFSVLLDRFGG
jgi:hypothetical protein